MFNIYSHIHGLLWWLSSKEPTCNAGDSGDWGSSSGWVRSPEEGMAAHCSVLAWKTSWTEKPGGLQCMEGKEAAEHTHTYPHTYDLLMFPLWLDSSRFCVLEPYTHCQDITWNMIITHFTIPK